MSDEPWDTFDRVIGHVRNFFAAIGLVSALIAAGYFFERLL